MNNLKIAALKTRQSKAITSGFTLAEILITLTIIGVVASLTIPSLVNNIGDQSYKAAWKKTYASFMQAGMSIANNNSGNLAGLFGTDIANDNIMRDYYLQYLNYTKKCDSGREVADGCWHASDKFYKFSGQVKNQDYSLNAGFILNNGSLVIIDLTNTSCSNTTSANQDTCGVINIDINGFQGPNKIGKDIYGMVVLRNGTVAPKGADGDYYANIPDICGCNPSDTDTDGWNCSAQYLYQ